MYAIVRKNTYDLGKLAEAEQQLEQFNKRHAEQPGFLGSLSVDIGDGRCVVVNLWEDKRSAEAALPTMVPVVTRFVEPLFAKPSELIGSGPVTLTDFQAVGMGHA